MDIQTRRDFNEDTIQLVNQIVQICKHLGVELKQDTTYAQLWANVCKELSAQKLQTLHAMIGENDSDFFKCMKTAIGKELEVRGVCYE